MTASAAAVRPTIVTVDDDPSVSRAVARDLRRRYGEAHRVLRADSGEQALGALREIKLRGEQVAVILADHRMPQMTGLEFLEQAMDLFPAARRVLLTAYADTDAAIEAINVVDLDHYLLKPWDPPEEKLYPVVDAMLDAWRESDHGPVPEAKVVGHRWSARSHEVRDFLARNQVPYRWYNCDEPEGARLLAAAGAGRGNRGGNGGSGFGANGGSKRGGNGTPGGIDGDSDRGGGTGIRGDSGIRGVGGRGGDSGIGGGGGGTDCVAGEVTLPVVITEDGEALVSPTDAELAARVGLSTSASADFYDLIVVGGGPAGLGAAVYGASEGLRTVLVERTATGGQAGQSSRIENYLGFPDGVSGAQLTDRARRQATKFGAEVLTTRDVVGLEAHGSARTVRFADGGRIDAHTVILATGVSYRRLDAAGLDGLTGCGVFYGSAVTEAPGCAGEDVYVVGGANSAGQAAVYFARHAQSVTILVRGHSLEASMSHYLIQQIAGFPTISVRTCTEVVAGDGTEHLESLILRDSTTGRTETVAARWLFVFIGAAPRTAWLDGVVVRDSRGFVVAGPDLVVDGRRPAGWTLNRDPFILETSLPGVFAAGDVRADSVKRVASAVGEGATAVTLVHRYLEKR